MNSEEIETVGKVIDLMVALKESLQGGHNIKAAPLPYRATRRTCANCGCSEEAIKHFGWKCDRPSNGVVASRPTNISLGSSD